MESDELVGLIERAFPAHPLPAVTLRQVTLSDQGIAREISDAEWESAGRIDRDTPWTALMDGDLIACKSGVAHLTEPEFSYYLGALLRFAVRHLDAALWTPEGELVGAVLFTVTDYSGARADYVHARWASLTLGQTEVIRRFLDYVRTHSDRYRADADGALAGYWSAPAQQPR
jgi:hypothetical protein